MSSIKRIPYHASIANRPSDKIPQPPYTDFCPITLCDGSQVDLPIEPLPGTDQAIVLLMSNQTSFVVEQKLAALLSEVVKEFNPEVIVGIPTMGLDYARLVAANLGFAHYVALGNSRKFWYDDELSIPVSSITSPGAKKKLYLDPSLVERVAGKRTLIIDDVIATGGSVSSAISLLQRAGADIVGLGFVFSELDPWKKVLAGFGNDWLGRVRVIGEIPRLVKTPAGWIPLA